MRVGIFLGYGPDIVLGKEGLGRYLGNLIKNLQTVGNQVTIACPKWLCSTLEDLLEDFFVDINEIEFIIADKMPVLWRIYNWRIKGRRKKRNKLLRKGFQWSAEFWVDVMSSITNIFLFLLIILFLLCMAVISLPFILIGSLVCWLVLLMKNIYQKGNNRVKSAFIQLIKVYEEVCYESLGIFLVFYYKFMENAQRTLVKKINKSQKLDVWYSPAIFWPIFNDIDAKKVINAPDLVTMEFATKWGDRISTLYSSKQCEKTISNGENFIVYAGYVKESLLEQKFNINEKNIVVIPHGINDMEQYIAFDHKIICKMEETLIKRYCKGLLQTLVQNTKEVTDYVRGFQFADVPYIFYPSQLRLHKNILNLVKAYEYLLRKKYVRIKLFLTCSLDDGLDVKKYIHKHRLQYDILCFNNVSVQQLAALYRCADLVVNPTLYEGGFPFTFGEGMSVGTPSVMSRIPQVTETVDGYDWDDYLFDPYDYKDMANKIIYGLEHREELISVQQVLFDDMKRRTWEVIGKEYVEAFQYFMEKDEEGIGD